MCTGSSQHLHSLCSGTPLNPGTFMVPLTLPTDIWSHVAGFLNVKDAARLSGERSIRQALFLM